VTDNDVQPGEDHKAFRRKALVGAAFNRIAEAGFEGLRTRDVAADAGVNIATLHYYFPTKEALIRGVVGHAVLRFHDAMPHEGSAADQLRWHLAALRRLLKEDTDLFAVLGELTLRAGRDPIIAEILKDTDEPWHRMVSDLLRRGIEQGCLDANLNPDDAAALMIAAIKGISLSTVAERRPARIEQTLDQLERWLGLSPTDSP
jgi:AcrR family transcriptional regulator